MANKNNIPKVGELGEFDDADLFLEYLQKYVPDANSYFIGVAQQITHAYSKLFKIGSSKLSKYNLTGAQFNILHSLLMGELLWGLDWMYPSQISEMISSSRTNISGLLSRMEKKGWVSREIYKYDKRRYKIQLTSEGREIISQVFQPFFLSFEALANHFDDEEMKILFLSLKNLNIEMKAHDEETDSEGED